MQLYSISIYCIIGVFYTEPDTLRLIQCSMNRFFWSKKVYLHFFKDRGFKHSENVLIMSEKNLLRQDKAKVAKTKERIP